MKPWAQYVIAFMIFCRGFVYVRIGSMLPAPVKGWKGSSLLFGDGIGNLQLILCCREGGRVDTKHDSPWRKPQGDPNTPPHISQPRETPATCAVRPRSRG